MKMKNYFSKVCGTIFMAASALSVQAQTNLGADCGCPPVSSRPQVLLSTLAISGGANDGDLIANNTILDCSKKWVMDKKIYVPSGKNITINPGTVIMGQDLGTGNASALIVQRDAKIIASGTETCPIVFTSVNDPMDGSYGVANRGKWGGLVVLGKATNNLQVGNTYCAGATGIGFVEGYASADTRNLYGSATPDDNDNSGILRYISIRHAGDILAVGNELNGLSLGSVGRGTTIDHIEVVACDDDAIEFFGGTVNIKYASALFGADDMFDYDLGWNGKAQFLFGMQADSATTPTADNGIEGDGDDNKSNALPRSHPKFYNITLVGNYTRTSVGDNSGHVGMKLKELTEGEFYNSIVSNFGRGVDFIKSFSAPRTFESYANWASGNATSGSLVLNCNSFLNNAVGPLTVGNSVANVLSTDNTKFTTDNNVILTSLTGFDYTSSLNTSTNVYSNKFNVIPTTNVATTCPTPQNDGFFTNAPYRGAFEAGKKSWMAGWSYFANYSSTMQATFGMTQCPTDVNQDGTTNNADFLQLLGQFNQTCN
jgi:hypothetical protein